MKKDIRVIAFDLDDTALDKSKTLRPVVAEAIERAAQAGIVVLPATGRMLQGIPDAVRALEGVRYAISANGARVSDLATGKLLREDCFSTELALSVLRQSQQYPCMIGFYIDGRGYSTGLPAQTMRGAVEDTVLDYLIQSRTLSDNPAELIANSQAPVEKFSNHFFDMDALEEARQAMARRGDVAVTASLRTNIEINTLSANKGSALLWLAGYLGFSPEQVMAVGDSSNDAEMLRQAGYSVAMGSAPDDLKALADDVTGSCQEDGLAKAILRVLA